MAQMTMVRTSSFGFMVTSRIECPREARANLGECHIKSPPGAKRAVERQVVSRSPDEAHEARPDGRDVDLALEEPFDDGTHAPCKGTFDDERGESAWMMRPSPK